MGNDANGRILVWFSCGAASACAAKLASEKYQGDNLEIVYCHTIKWEHPDNMRFLRDVEQWVGLPIKLLKTHKDEYLDDDGAPDIYKVFSETGWLVGGLAGRTHAKCTEELKRKVRERYQQPGDLHIFGMVAEEHKRIANFEKVNSFIDMEWNLRDAGMTKRDCLKMIKQAGIELPMMYRLGYKNNNCFTGTTRFLTRNGYQTLESQVGSLVDVLTGSGWTPAKIEHHGEQQIWEIDLKRNGQVYTIQTTSGHEWKIPKYVNQSQGTKNVPTCQLNPGMVIPAGFAFGQHSSLEPSIDGIQHGFVFGDGSLQSENYSKANFCGDKKEMAKYFDQTKYHEGNSGVGVIHGLPTKFRSIPPMGSTPEYKLGFLCGLIASDGCAVKGGIQISNKSRETLVQVTQIANSLGIFTNQIISNVRDTNFKKDARISVVSIPTICMKREWILRSKHQLLFNSKTTRPKGFTVCAVRKTNRIEKVYCAFVPDGHEFTIEHGILTRNCIGCVKGGVGYWNKIRKDFPDVFQKMAKTERAMGITINRLSIGGVRKRVYLDEMDPEAGRYEAEPDIDCGPQCVAPAWKEEDAE